ncbi:hypothetical protein CRH09_25570 [Nocardia terpenica]|uniref:Uncharacterized protein n=2 Tax=Nocardia terpenica TaxID=455432 RepID=A0A291RN80_9NOCA|nr:hypothetical protein CRH09_25570 [Nocardia terpenica]
MGSDDDLPVVNVEPWRADAIVLYDWLASVDLDAVPITHRAQKQALMDLFTRFQWAADYDLQGCSQGEITAAQEDVAKDMGW